MKLFKHLKNKKGIFADLGGLGIGLTTFCVLLAVAFIIMAQVKSQIVTSDGSNATMRSNAYNATNTLIDAAATIPGWTGIIVIVAIGAAILGLLGMFGGRRE